MQFPESWLREFCDPPLSTQALADTLTMAGMEVEEVRPVAPPFSGVVVGEVLTVAKHPSADRLHICQVSVGVQAVLSIVCGAPNVRVGIKVPCALVGARLPPVQESGSPFEIKLGQLRGVPSQGMLCSAAELKLPELSPGLLVLPEDAPVGASVRDYLQLDDQIFTLKLTPNLAHCLSLWGVARELSALTGAPLRKPVIKPAVPTHTERLPVRVLAPDLCGRFAGRVVRGVNAQAPTPAWMAERLIRCGQRPVCALVDISNYVMFELGQPSHMFDLQKIDRELTVRWAQEGETVTLLNGQTLTLSPQVGVMADTHAIESMAGIMGAQRCAVDDKTQQVYIEAAFWWPAAIAGRARKYQFSTDASHRFERGVDPAQVTSCLERITELVLDICGGECGPIDDQVIHIPQVKPLTLRVARAEKIIGIPVSSDQCQEVLQRLGLHVQAQAGVLTVTPPSWRFDLQIEEDLIEEVIRVIGFDQLPVTAPLAPMVPCVRPEGFDSVHVLRHRVASLDYQETINFSFVQERWERELAGASDPIRLLNPIAEPLSVMRSGLWGGLLAVLRFNLARKASRVRLFELGRVFQKDASVLASHHSVAGIAQPLRLGGLAYGPVAPLHWQVKDQIVDFFDVKGDVQTLFQSRPVRFVPTQHPALHPGRAAQVELAGCIIGYVGELHPRWRQSYELPLAPILFELSVEALQKNTVPQAQPVARQQSVWRDIAVVASPTLSHDALIQAILETDRTIIRSAQLFDLYQPSAAAAQPGFALGELSLAVRLEFLDEAQALTDERVDTVVAAVMASLTTRFQVRLRTS